MSLFTIRAVLLVTLLALTSLPELWAKDDGDRLRVLLLSGQNNHDWRATTPRIESILEDSGRFTVEVTDHPEQVTADALRPYDVVVSNWNSFHRGDQFDGVTDWPETTRRAYVEFVRGGKGFVMVHAGGSSHYDWPEYHELVVASYGFNQTGHGVRHAFPVRFDGADHPITSGMRPCLIHDELWHNASVVPGATVLASAWSATDKGGSGKYEPIAFVRPFGRGRCFATLLGHDVYSLRQPVSGSLLCRGTEWAATGVVTLPLPTRWPTTPAGVAALQSSPDEAFDAIRTYRFGQDRAALQTIMVLVSATEEDPLQRAAVAERMTSLLADEVTADCKRFLCKQLGQIGSAEHVPALAALLNDPRSAVAARGALEAIAGPHASAALCDALASTDGAVRVGLIHSLARLREPDAIPLIVPLLETDHHDTREAALAALGRIGGPAARRALLAVVSDLPDELESTSGTETRRYISTSGTETRRYISTSGTETRRYGSSSGTETRRYVGIWADAVLRCAARQMGLGDHQAATPLYEALLAGELPAHVRVAALSGQLACQGRSGGDLLSSALLNGDTVTQAAALRALREYGDAEQLEGLASRLGELSETLQPQAVALLASKGASSALPALVQIADQADSDLRHEVLRALGALGDETTIPVLLAKLDGASPAARALIADSLARPQSDVGHGDPALRSDVGHGDPALRSDGVNARMIAMAKTAEPEHARMLVSALAVRRATEAVPMLLELARRDDSKLADGAVGAVGKLGSGDACLPLIDLLRDRQRTASADVIRRALVQVSRRLPQSSTEPTLWVLESADERLAAELMPILSTLGGSAALAAVHERTTAGDDKLRLAAVRALAAWREPVALEPLLDVARSASSLRERTLALRGFARLLPLSRDPSANGRAALLASAIRLAERPDQIKALLACAPSAPSGAVLRWVTACLDEAALSGEASLAALALVQPLEQSHREQVLIALRRIVTIHPNQQVHSRALPHLCRLGGLVNLALAAAADSPDGWEPDHDGREADAAIDGDPETYWDEQDNQELYRLRLRFDEPTTVAAIGIRGYRHHYHVPRGFAVLCDGREVVRVADATYADNYLAVALPETTCTTLELAITDYYNGSPAIRELEVYGLLSTADPPQLEWSRTDSTLTLLNQRRPVWRFNYGPAAPKPFFHPLALADGTVLTWEAPPDHPWHHALWFSWKYLNGVNYWEESRQTGQSEGRTTVRDLKIRPSDDHTARIELSLCYAPPDAAPVLTEQRVIETTAPDEFGRYHLDWLMTFTAGEEDVVLDRTPLAHEPGGKTWGGYAGLAFRFAQAFRDPQAVSTDGAVTAWTGARHYSKASAMEYHGLIDDRPVGVAILDHPDNPNAPSPWYLIRSKVMTYFNPALICYEPYTLRAGASFTLRYRVIVHPGHWGLEDLQRELAGFIQPRPD